jgi:hypothetical protein
VSYGFCRRPAIELCLDAPQPCRLLVPWFKARRLVSPAHAVCSTLGLIAPLCHVTLQVQLCKHRLGMVCAAGRDYRSATLLLGDTLQHYRQQQQGHPLAHEAELGLAMARYGSW